MKLEDILKSKGWTDEDLAAVKPMLENARFRADLEAQYGAVATERDSFKQLNDDWQRKLDEEYNPRMNTAEKAASDARIALAEANEKLKIAKDYGYFNDQAEAEAEVAVAAARVAAANDPKNFVSRDDLKRQVLEFGEQEAEAIVTVQDLAAEYAHLYDGRSLFEYEGQNGLRGMRALRQEAKAKRMGMDAYVAEKFNFVAKRQELTAKKQKDHDDLIRKEEAEKVRAEMAAQYGNPLMRNAIPSAKPFIPGVPAGGKQPWETTAQDRRATRVARLLEIQAKGAVQ